MSDRRRPAPRAPIVFDPERHCGAETNREYQGGHPCRMVKGFKTEHPGAGQCYLHGGRSPNGNRHAAKEAATRALTRLGIPVGSGDPMDLLTKTVRHAEGYLEGTAAVLKEAAAKDGAKFVDVEAIANLHAEAIRAAARTGKGAIDAKLAERQAALDERAANLLERFIGELLERVVPAKRRPELTVWARDRLTELAAEYDSSTQVH